MGRQHNTCDARTPEQGERTLSENELDAVTGGRKAGRDQLEFFIVKLEEVLVSR